MMTWKMLSDIDASQKPVKKYQMFLTLTFIMSFLCQIITANRFQAMLRMRCLSLLSGVCAVLEKTTLNNKTSYEIYMHISRYNVLIIVNRFKYESIET